MEHNPSDAITTHRKIRTANKRRLFVALSWMEKHRAADLAYYPKVTQKTKKAARCGG
ncbi:MAG: hypothetical protein PHW76_01810 [Alphaproteobacteria bacterium]|nr:hypothetical protein [Alphaproteobacteria bacterium]